VYSVCHLLTQYNDRLQPRVDQEQLATPEQLLLVGERRRREKEARDEIIRKSLLERRLEELQEENLRLRRQRPPYPYPPPPYAFLPPRPTGINNQFPGTDTSKRRYSSFDHRDPFSRSSHTPAGIHEFGASYPSRTKFSSLDHSNPFSTTRSLHSTAGNLDFFPPSSSASSLPSGSLGTRYRLKSSPTLHISDSEHIPFTLPPRGGTRSPISPSISLPPRTSPLSGTSHRNNPSSNWHELLPRAGSTVSTSTTSSSTPRTTILNRPSQGTNRRVNERSEPRRSPQGRH